MEVRELEQERSKSQTVKNILDKDFDFKWDGIDYTIAKGETQSYPFYLAEHCALHMARAHCNKKKLNFVNQAGKVVDDIMGKDHIEYDALSDGEARELAKERGIPLVTEEGKKKNKATVIQDLKNSH